MSSNNGIKKPRLSLRSQIAIIVFLLMFIFSSVMIILFNVFITTKSFDRVLLNNISDNDIGVKVVQITKDYVTNNFWNSIGWVLIANALVDVVAAYSVSIWISKPFENLLIGLNNAYIKGIPYIGLTDSKFTEVEDISNVVSEMAKRYIDTLEIQNLFIQDISHELKTPLAAIKSTADLINYNPSPTIEDYKQFYKTSQIMNQRMINLVNQLTLTSKTDAEVYDSEDVNLSELLKDIIEDFYSKAEEKKIKISYDIEKEIYIKGSIRYLSVAISNLVDNAIRYSDKENSEVNISLERKRSSILLKITDHGIGISAIDIKNIFDRFYRGENAQINNPGSGLGLAITKKIIKAHDGRITIRSKLGSGSEVRVVF